MQMWNLSNALNYLLFFFLVMTPETPVFCFSGQLLSLKGTFLMSYLNFMLSKYLFSRILTLNMVQRGDWPMTISNFIKAFSYPLNHLPILQGVLLTFFHISQYLLPPLQLAQPSLAGGVCRHIINWELNMLGMQHSGGLPVCSIVVDYQYAA